VTTQSTLYGSSKHLTLLNVGASFSYAQRSRWRTPTSRPHVSTQSTPGGHPVRVVSTKSTAHEYPKCLVLVLRVSRMEYPVWPLSVLTVPSWVLRVPQLVLTGPDHRRELLRRAVSSSAAPPGKNTVAAALALQPLVHAGESRTPVGYGPRRSVGCMSRSIACRLRCRRTRAHRDCARSTVTLSMQSQAKLGAEVYKWWLPARLVPQEVMLLLLVPPAVCCSCN
jgi:hypothetical protein